MTKFHKCMAWLLFNTVLQIAQISIITYITYRVFVNPNELLMLYVAGYWSAKILTWAEDQYAVLVTSLGRGEK